MYKGQSIDCSYFLGKDSSFAYNYNADDMVETPYSSLKGAGVVNGLQPILWYNKKYVNKYYISTQRVDETDIAIGILVDAYKTKYYIKGSEIKDNGISYSTYGREDIRHYTNDNLTFSFLSTKFLDVNDINGSKYHIENVYYNDYEASLGFDLRGYGLEVYSVGQHSIEDQLYSFAFYHIADSLQDSIKNTENCWSTYDNIRPNWKTDSEFKSYAKSCYLYSTPGTKQGDWKMIDLNSFCFLLSGHTLTGFPNFPSGWKDSFKNSYCRINNVEYFISNENNRTSMLTAFTSLLDHSHKPDYQGEFFTYKLFGYSKQNDTNGTGWIYVEKDKASTCLAQLNLPISMFKFKNE